MFKVMNEVNILRAATSLIHYVCIQQVFAAASHSVDSQESGKQLVFGRAVSLPEIPGGDKDSTNFHAHLQSFVRYVHAADLVSVSPLLLAKNSRILREELTSKLMKNRLQNIRRKRNLYFKRLRNIRRQVQLIANTEITQPSVTSMVPLRGSTEPNGSERDVMVTNGESTNMLTSISSELVSSDQVVSSIYDIWTVSGHGKSDSESTNNNRFSGNILSINQSVGSHEIQQLMTISNEPITIKPNIDNEYSVQIATTSITDMLSVNDAPSYELNISTDLQSNAESRISNATETGIAAAPTSDQTESTDKNISEAATSEHFMNLNMTRDISQAIEITGHLTLSPWPQSNPFPENNFLPIETTANSLNTETIPYTFTDFGKISNLNQEREHTETTSTHEISLRPQIDSYEAIPIVNATEVSKPIESQSTSNNSDVLSSIFSTNHSNHMVSIASSTIANGLITDNSILADTFISQIGTTPTEKITSRQRIESSTAIGSTYLLGVIIQNMTKHIEGTSITVDTLPEAQKTNIFADIMFNKASAQYISEVNATFSNAQSSWLKTTSTNTVVTTGNAISNMSIDSVDVVSSNKHVQTSATAFTTVTTTESTSYLSMASKPLTSTAGSNLSPLTEKSTSYTASTTKRQNFNISDATEAQFTYYSETKIQSQELTSKLTQTDQEADGHTTPDLKIADASYRASQGALQTASMLSTISSSAASADEKSSTQNIMQTIDSSSNDELFYLISFQVIVAGTEDVESLNFKLKMKRNLVLLHKFAFELKYANRPATKDGITSITILPEISLGHLQVNDSMLTSSEQTAPFSSPTPSTSTVDRRHGINLETEPNSDVSDRSMDYKEYTNVSTSPEVIRNPTELATSLNSTIPSVGGQETITDNSIRSSTNEESSDSKLKTMMSISSIPTPDKKTTNTNDIRQDETKMMNIDIIIYLIRYVDSSRKRRQSERTAEIQYVVLENDIPIKGGVVRSSLSLVNMSKMSEMLGVSVLRYDPVTVPSTDTNSSLEDAPSTSMTTCCVAATVLGILLGTACLLNAIYFTYATEMEKKKKKEIGKEPFDLKLITEKDRLLRENGELTRQLRQMERNYSAKASVALHDDFQQEESFISALPKQNATEIAESGSQSHHPHLSIACASPASRKALQTSGSSPSDFQPVSITHGTSNPKSFTQQRFAQMHSPDGKVMRVPLGENGSPLVTFGPDGKLQFKSPSSTMGPPPPGTGKPGQLLLEKRRKYSECALAMQDAFKTKHESNPYLSWPTQQKSAKKTTKSLYDYTVIDREKTKPHLTAIRSKSATSIMAAAAQSAVPITASQRLPAMLHSKPEVKDVAVNATRFEVTQSDLGPNLTVQPLYTDKNCQKVITGPSQSPTTLSSIERMRLRLNIYGEAVSTQTEFASPHSARRLSEPISTLEKYNVLIADLRKQINMMQQRLEKTSTLQPGAPKVQSKSPTTGGFGQQVLRYDPHLTRTPQRSKHSYYGAASGRGLHHGRLDQRDEDRVNIQPPPLSLRQGAVPQQELERAASQFMEHFAPLLSKIGYRVSRDGQEDALKPRTTAERLGDTRTRPYKEYVKRLYGNIEPANWVRSEIVKMTQQGFSLNTIARIHSLTPDETASIMVDAYMMHGNIEPERLMKDLHADIEQMVAVRNFLKHHQVKDKLEIAQHMPAHLQIGPNVLKLALALMYHEYI